MLYRSVPTAIFSKYVVGSYENQGNSRVAAAAVCAGGGGVQLFVAGLSEQFCFLLQNREGLLQSPYNFFSAKNGSIFAYI